MPNKNPPSPSDPGLDSLIFQTEILSRIARGAALAKILSDVAAMIEHGAKGNLCGICVRDAEQPTVTASHGPGLPAAFREALLGARLDDPSAGPCALACCEKRTIVADDAKTDPRWKGSRWSALMGEHGFTRCQTTPILDAGDRVLGTLALYGRSGNIEMPDIFGETAAHLAAIAIERRRDEKALLDSEERLRLAIEGANLGTWDWNLRTGELIWSDRCKEMFGHPPETCMTYDLFLASLHPEDRGRADAAVRESLAADATYNIEFRSVWPDGTVRWISSIGRGFREDGGGKPAFMRGVALDITERKRAEASAIESAEQFRFLAESLPEKIFTATADGETYYFNRQWANYTGLPVEEVLRLGWREFVHPDDREEKMSLWNEAMRTGVPFEFEHRFRRADGTYRWHLSRAHPMRHADGTISMWIGSNTDVDDLKQAQFALGESESRSRLAIEAARLGFWDLDSNGRVKRSPEYNRMYGFDPAQAEGTIEESMNRIHPEDREAFAAALDAAKRGREDFAVEFRTVDEEKSVRWIAAHGRAYYDEQTGEPVRMIGVVREITERKKFEDQLRRNQEELRSALAAAELAREQAEAAGRAKDQFMAVLSHELRTPLTPVLMAVSSIRSESGLSAETKEALDMIQRNIRIEARLIEDLLDLTRITRNKLELRMERFDLHTALREALEVCAFDLEAGRHRITVDLAAENSMINGDLARLQQVFWNLIKNAVKFTPREGKIRVRSWNDEGSVHVEVSDSGVGIHREFLPRIFNPFEQGDRNFFRKYGGLGLGLAISKATIEAHQGTITAHSSGENLGATFLVELPTLTTPS